MLSLNVKERWEQFLSNEGLLISSKLSNEEGPWPEIIGLNGIFK